MPGFGYATAVFAFTTYASGSITGTTRGGDLGS